MPSDSEDNRELYEFDSNYLTTLNAIRRRFNLVEISSEENASEHHLDRDSTPSPSTSSHRDLYEFDGNYLTELNSIRKKLNLKEIPDETENACEINYTNKEKLQELSKMYLDKSMNSEQIAYTPPKKKKCLRAKTPKLSRISTPPTAIAIYDKKSSYCWLTSSTSENTYEDESEEEAPFENILSFRSKATTGSSNSRNNPKSVTTEEDFISLNSATTKSVNSYRERGKSPSARLLYDNSRNIVNSSYSESCSTRKTDVDSPRVEEEEGLSSGVSSGNRAVVKSKGFILSSTSETTEISSSDSKEQFKSENFKHSSLNVPFSEMEKHSDLVPHVTIINSGEESKQRRKKGDNRIRPLKIEESDSNSLKSIEHKANFIPDDNVLDYNLLMTSSLELPRKVNEVCNFPSIAAVTSLVQSLKKEVNLDKICDPHHPTIGNKTFEKCQEMVGYSQIAQDLLRAPVEFKAEKCTLAEVETISNLSDMCLVRRKQSTEMEFYEVESMSADSTESDESTVIEANNLGEGCGCFKVCFLGKRKKYFS